MDDSKSGARARSNLRAVERALSSAVSRERARWVRELHDTIAQDLAALILQLESARADLVDIQPSITRALALARNCVLRVRRSLRTSAAVPVLQRGLGTALQSWAYRWARRTGLRCRLRICAADGEVPPDAQAELYRIAQEALANVLRHARADRVRVSWTSGRDHWLLSVEDNGVGFQAYPNPNCSLCAVPNAGDQKGIGLRVMAERAAEIGACLTIKSAPGRGTLLSVQYPLDARARTPGARA